VDDTGYEHSRARLLLTYISRTAGHAVAQLVEALRYKPEFSMVSMEIFHRHNPSSLTMALGLAQALTEIITRNTSLGVKAAGA